MKKVLLILALIGVTLSALLLNYFFNPSYDNETDKDSLITVSYSEGKIDELKELIDNYFVSLTHIKAMVHVQCLRKTPFGYYIILKQNDGKDVIITLNEELYAMSVLVIDEYKNSEDFDEIQEDISTREDVDRITESKIVLELYSGSEVHYYVLQDGVLILIYETSSLQTVFIKEFVDWETCRGIDENQMVVSFFPTMLDIDLN
ncbi:MAG: hypothetical protein IJY24_02830 [Clostridia bacterium]|nr:hypothetical protein [Clostridia bacterium]